MLESINARKDLLIVITVQRAATGGAGGEAPASRGRVSEHCLVLGFG